MDVNGIYRAPTEMMLSNVEVFFDSIIFGYTVNHMFSTSREQFNARPYNVFWILIDCLLMFLTLGYV
jgi:hypothetical protein